MKKVQNYTLQKLPIFFKEEKFSYTQINEAANKVANGLQAVGIKAGDKVALTCTNIPAFSKEPDPKFEALGKLKVL